MMQNCILIVMRDEQINADKPPRRILRRAPAPSGPHHQPMPQPAASRRPESALQPDLAARRQAAVSLFEEVIAVQRPRHQGAGNMENASSMAASKRHVRSFGASALCCSYLFQGHLTSRSHWLYRASSTGECLAMKDMTVVVRAYACAY